MKTTPFARRLVKARLVLGSLGLLVLVAMELGLGEALAARSGQAPSGPSAAAPVWPSSGGIADLFAATR